MTKLFLSLHVLYCFLHSALYIMMIIISAIYKIYDFYTSVQKTLNIPNRESPRRFWASRRRWVVNPGRKSPSRGLKQNSTLLHSQEYISDVRINIETLYLTHDPLG